MVSGINKRKEKDVMKLLVSDYNVQVVNEALNNEFIVKFIGPKDSPYEGVSSTNTIHSPIYNSGWRKNYSNIITNSFQFYFKR